MSPITHLFASWVVAAKTTNNIRDRRLVTLAGVLPDADGLGVLVDMVTGAGGRPATQLYWQYHHYLLHGLFGGLLISLGMACFAQRKLRVFLLALCVFHLHLLCDIVGSRGPSRDDLWPVFYLGPFTKVPMWVWKGQWGLESWPNRLTSIVLLFWSMALAVRLGDSVVGVFNRRVDAVFVGVLRKWRDGLALKHPAVGSLLRPAGIIVSICFLILAGLRAYRPNLFRFGPGPTIGITQNLRQIDAAKQKWSLEHHQDKTKKITEKDLSPYLSLQSDGHIRPVADERYVIGKLTESPAAILISEVDEYPAGTVIRLGTNADIIILQPGKH